MNGYTPPTDPPTNVAGKKPSENNGKSMNLILYGLSESEFVKVMHCELAKEIWDKLQNIFEGNNKVNKVKLQAHWGQFESLKTKDEENVAASLLRVYDILNTINGLCEKVCNTPVLTLFSLKKYML